MSKAKSKQSLINAFFLYRTHAHSRQSRSPFVKENTETYKSPNLGHFHNIHNAHRVNNRNSTIYHPLNVTSSISKDSHENTKFLYQTTVGYTPHPLTIRSSKNSIIKKDRTKMHSTNIKAKICIPKNLHITINRFKKSSPSDNSYNRHLYLLKKSTRRNQKNVSFDLCDQNREEIEESNKLTEEAKKLLTSKEYEKAIKLLDKAIKIWHLNYDAKYYRSIAYLDNNKSEEAVNELNEVIKKNPNYNRACYLLLSIAYRRINNIHDAIKILNFAIQKYPDYADAFLSRAQIYFSLDNYSMAEQDFISVINLTPNNPVSLIGAGDCQLKQMQFINAIDNFSLALECTHENKGDIYKRRGIAFYKNKKFKEALNDFVNALKENEDSTLLNYYKGKALIKISKKVNFKQAYDAILSFEHVIMNAPEKKISAKAILQIAKIRAKQKDFYESFYTVQRKNQLKTPDYAKLNEYSILINGIISVIKRKTKSGIKLLTEILNDNHKLKHREKGMALIYRGFAFLCTFQYEKALQDYNKSTNYKKVSKSTKFNILFSKTMMNILLNNYSKALDYANDTIKEYDKNKCIKVYRIIIMIEQYIQLHINSPDESEQLLNNTFKEFNTFVNQNNQEHQFIFLRGCLLLYKKEFVTALEDFDNAIKINDESNSDYHLMRGICYACLSLFKEALSDFSLTIKMKENCLLAYLNRGKSAYLLGDSNLAFEDFQKLLSLRPDDPKMHILAGNLLMTNGAYEDATKAYSQVFKLSNNAHIHSIYQRARCFAALTMIEESYSDLVQVLDVLPEDSMVRIDKQVMEILRSAIKSKIKDYEAYKKCIEKLTHIFLNLDREIINENLFNAKNKKMQRIIDFIEAPCSYKENIFNKEDIILYRGILNLYANEFEEAISDLNKSQVFKRENGENSVQSDDHNNNPNVSVDTDLSDVGLCSLNTHEHTFNIILCFLLNNKFQDALEKCNSLIDNSPQKYKKNMWILRASILFGLSKTKEALLDLEKAKADGCEIKLNLHLNLNLNEKQSIQLEIFDSNGRLCSHFPFLQFKFNNNLELLMRPSFSFPFIKPPNMIPYPDIQVLEMFDIKKINCKPEAPWLKHSGNSYTFTDEIIEGEAVDELEEDLLKKMPIYLPCDIMNKYKKLGSHVKIKASSENNFKNKEDIEKYPK